ncbi:MAG: hypothetical protein KF773_42020 [Deltaproteobacteria bacterium]|nr:hypothetical protein [Deltaproteobacteria bacterium]MCW5808900.1 hypothetical protein [Deltaproteobacteria bacterium]
MKRCVRGILFVDYVRMLRRLKLVDWSRHLPPEDVALLAQQIDNDAWYPMATFERFGNAILQNVAQGQMAMVQMWGRYSAGQLRAANPTLLAPDDPIETLHRFTILRKTFFDFEALHIPLLHEGEANIQIAYFMGMPAEEAASFQTLGFFEGLLELAGARAIEGRFRSRSWAGGEGRTVAELRWEPPKGVS